MIYINVLKGNILLTIQHLFGYYKTKAKDLFITLSENNALMTNHLEYL